MKLGQVLEKTIQFFKDKGFQSARLDSELILSAALGVERIQLYLKFDQPLKEDELQKCRDLVKRRSTGEPVAYILGQKEFYGNAFHVSAGVLVPRPETELVVDYALTWMQSKGFSRCRILDLGSGSGCIGLSILLRSENSELVSTDLSEIAIESTTKNASFHKMEGRTRVVQVDLSNKAAVDQKIQGKFDVIVANPPYIDRNDSLIEENVKKFEPESALFSGENGFEDIRKWTENTKALLKVPGIFLMEVGWDQGEKTKNLFLSLGIFSDVEVIKDLSGKDRVIRGVLNG